MTKKSCIFIIFFIMLLSNVNAKTYNATNNKREDTNKTIEKSPFLKNEKLTIKELSTKHDDDYVVLEGYIVKKIKGNKFLFRDSTGEIEIEIENKRKYLLENVNDKTLIEISGEYEKNTFKNDEIEVKNLKIIMQY